MLGRREFTESLADVFAQLFAQFRRAHDAFAQRYETDDGLADGP